MMEQKPEFEEWRGRRVLMAPGHLKDSGEWDYKSLDGAEPAPATDAEVLAVAIERVQKAWSEVVAGRVAEADEPIIVEAGDGRSIRMGEVAEGVGVAAVPASGER